MQFSNGLHNPVGLWLGHLAFDGIFTVIMATAVTIIFAAASNQFHGLGFFVRFLRLERDWADRVKVGQHEPWEENQG